MLDSKLTWKPQIKIVMKKVNRALYGLRFIKTCLTQEVRKRLIMALIVILHLDYCSVVYLEASAQPRTRLQRLSNSCIKYIYGVRMCERITSFRISLGWLHTDTRRLNLAAILMYQIPRLNKIIIILSSFYPKGISLGVLREVIAKIWQILVFGRTLGSCPSM